MVACTRYVATGHIGPRALLPLLAVLLLGIVIKHHIEVVILAIVAINGNRLT